MVRWMCGVTKNEMRMLRWMCGVTKNEMRMLRWMCGVTKNEMRMLRWMCGVTKNDMRTMRWMCGVTRNEMMMLRWTCGVTKKDKIRNEHARGPVIVAYVAKKFTEKRLKWHGRVNRRGIWDVLIRMAAAPVAGKRRGGGGRDRPVG